MSEDRGAKSLVWIKSQISIKFYTEEPITSILEITVKLKIKEDFKEEENKDPGVDLDNNKDSVRNKIYKYISSQLKGNREVDMNGHHISMIFHEEKATKVHHITQSRLNEYVKSRYIKTLLPELFNEMSLRFRRWIIDGNFLLTRPLEYEPEEEEIDSEMSVDD